MTTTPTKAKQPPAAKVAEEHPDHVAIKSYFLGQRGRASIKPLWADATGARYRVNFYITEGQGLIQMDRMISSFFVVVHEGLVIKADGR